MFAADDGDKFIFERTGGADVVHFPLKHELPFRDDPEIGAEFFHDLEDVRGEERYRRV